jgi:hypothetical protein
MTVPREALAAMTRHFIENHSEWDSPHTFAILYRSGDETRVGCYVCILPDVDPERYPALMAKAAEEWHEQHRDKPAYAFLLQIESHGVTAPRPDASEAERNQYEVDRLTRSFHKRPDAVEAAVAWCADVHGRLWTASKIRGKEDKINEGFYGPGTRSVDGQMIRGLLTVAYRTGVRDHGLPSPALWPVN